MDDERATEETVTEVVQRYGDQGFTTGFSARPDARVHCGGCGSEVAAGRLALKALHRFEGQSDPGDESAVAAVECTQCNARGVLVLSYGSGADPVEMAVLAALPDERHRSPFPAGV